MADEDIVYENHTEHRMKCVGEEQKPDLHSSVIRGRLISIGFLLTNPFSRLVSLNLNSIISSNSGKHRKQSLRGIAAIVHKHLTEDYSIEYETNKYADECSTVPDPCGMRIILGIGGHTHMGSAADTISSSS